MGLSQSRLSKGTHFRYLVKTAHTLVPLSSFRLQRGGNPPTTGLFRKVFIRIITGSSAYLELETPPPKSFMFCFSQKCYWLSGLVGSIVFKDTFSKQVNYNVAVYAGGGASVVFHKYF